MSRLAETPRLKPTITEKTIGTATLLAAPLLIPATRLLDFTITSTRGGRKAILESVTRGERQTRPHHLKNAFGQKFRGEETVAGSIGATDLVVDEVDVLGIGRMARTRFGGRLTKTHTKTGIVFGMTGGETVYSAPGGTTLLGNESITVAFNKAQ